MTFLERISETLALMVRRPVRCQFAALPWRRSETGELEILLVTSRDTGRWVIPKGWPMGDWPGHRVAAQEALEEAGITGPVEPRALGSFGYDKVIAEDVALPCRVQVHAMEVTDIGVPTKDKGQRRLDWVNPIEAAARVNEPELKALILAFARRMGAT